MIRQGCLISLTLLFPLLQVLVCFSDPDSRVRYYACESLYNIAKVNVHRGMRRCQHAEGGGGTGALSKC